MMKLCSVVCLLAFIAIIAEETESAVRNDEVTRLPLLRRRAPFKHYSGFLNGLSGKRLHYWFVESQRNPRRDPVVVWFNGGPGCSSMLGFLTENGPFIINSNATELLVNRDSWNKVANMLYIEAPAGVGFSYSKSKQYATGDNDVARNNHAAIKYFFKKYPEFRRNAFHISGESYSGIYIPTLSVLLQNEYSINFKGVLIGNGLYDYEMNSNSLIYFGYGHGLWDNKMQRKLIRNCCRGVDNGKCNFYRRANRGTACYYAIRAAKRSLWNLNVYNMYGKCYSKRNAYLMTAHSMTFPSMVEYNMDTMDESLTDGVESLKENTIGCDGPSPSYKYLNRNDVRRALHIPSFVPEWQLCNFKIFRSYNREYSNMRAQFKTILKTGRRTIKMFIFNGDVDMACNYLGDEQFVDSLKFLTLTSPRKQWLYVTRDGYTQVGGFVKKLGNLQFRTVLGSGHMVPTDKPEAALLMFKQYLQWAY